MLDSNRLTRRRFLADILFAGGAVAAAGLLARAGGVAVDSGPEPSPAGAVVADPTPCPPPQTDLPLPGEAVAPPLDGDVVMAPQPSGTPMPEPVVEGRVAMPEYAVPGGVAPPQPLTR